MSAPPTVTPQEMESLLETISPTQAARTLEKSDMTEEEVDRVQSSLKDPEFRRMLAEYMADIQSPATLKEYEDMLQNADGIPGMSKPEGKRLLKPEPWCTLEANRREDGSKVYVSLTCHEDVAEWSMDGTTSVLSLPCLTGPLNYEHDVEALARAKGDHSKVGSDVPTIEVCFSKASLHAATPAQLKLAERTAIEQADLRLAEADKAQGGGKAREKGGATATKEPSTAMVVGKAGGKKGSSTSSTNSLKVLEADYTFVKKNGSIVSKVDGQARTLMVSIEGGLVKPERASKGGGGGKKDPLLPTKPSTPSAPAKSASVIKPRGGGEGGGGGGGVTSPTPAPTHNPSLPLTLTPSYKVVEKASSITKDLTDSHLGLQRSAANFFTAPPIKRPGHLEVRITLPGVGDPSILDAELLDSRTLAVKTTAPVTPSGTLAAGKLEGGEGEEGGKTGKQQQQQARSPTLYSLSLRLPYPVLLGVEHTKVKFLREKEELKVTLSVEPPPAPTLIVNNGYTGENEDGEEKGGERDLTLPGKKSTSSSPLVTVVEETPVRSVTGSASEAHMGNSGASATGATATAAAPNPFVKGRIDAAPDYVPTPASPPTTSAQAAKKATPVVPTVVAKPAPPTPTPTPTITPSQPLIPADAAVPPYRWRETSLLVTIIIDVVGVDEKSVKMVWEPELGGGGGGVSTRSVASLVFREKAERGGKVWALRRMMFFRGIDATAPRTRVSTLDGNLCWVLLKSKEGEMWGKLLQEASEEVPTNSLPSSSSATTGGDITASTEASALAMSPILPPLPPSPKSQPLKSPPPPKVLFEMD